MYSLVKRFSVSILNSISLSSESQSHMVFVGKAMRWENISAIFRTAHQLQLAYAMLLSFCTFYCCFQSLDFSMKCLLKWFSFLELNSMQSLTWLVSLCRLHSQWQFSSRFWIEVRMSSAPDKTFKGEKRTSAKFSTLWFAIRLSSSSPLPLCLCICFWI